MFSVGFAPPSRGLAGCRSPHLGCNSLRCQKWTMAILLSIKTWTNQRKAFQVTWARKPASRLGWPPQTSGGFQLEAKTSSSVDCSRHSASCSICKMPLGRWWKMELQICRPAFWPNVTATSIENNRTTGSTVLCKTARCDHILQPATRTSCLSYFSAKHLDMSGMCVCDIVFFMMVNSQFVPQVEQNNIYPSMGHCQCLSVSFPLSYCFLFVPHLAPSSRSCKRQLCEICVNFNK